jgi:hypothetical protein
MVSGRALAKPSPLALDLQMPASDGRFVHANIADHRWSPPTVMQLAYTPSQVRRAGRCQALPDAPSGPRLRVMHA